MNTRPTQSPKHFRPGYPGGRKHPTGTTPRTAQATSLLKGQTPNEQAHSILEARKNPRRISVSFEVWEHEAPALRGAIDEIRGIVATRSEGKFEFPIEQALTDAISGLGKLAAAVNVAVPFVDPFYRGKK